MFEDESSAKLVNPFENVLSYSFSFCKTSTHFTKQIFSKAPLGYISFSVFTYSSELVLINGYVNGNEQHCVINKVHNNHDEVEKAIADFHASKLK